MSVDAVGLSDVSRRAGFARGLTGEQADKGEERWKRFVLLCSNRGICNGRGHESLADCGEAPC